MSKKNSPFKAYVNSVEPMDQGKWIQTRKINYTDPDGRPREWEMAIRTTRTETTGIDAVSILGIISGNNESESNNSEGNNRESNNSESNNSESNNDRQEGGKRIVLTKQFRPPCGKVVVEMPAGLVDPNESIQSTAERELLEETGYRGTVNQQSMAVFSDPGLTNANMSLVTVNIEASNNPAPEPQLEDGEYIEVFTLPLSNLYDGLVHMCRTEDVAVDSRLFHFAEGIRIAQALNIP